MDRDKRKELRARHAQGLHRDYVIAGDVHVLVGKYTIRTDRYYWCNECQSAYETKGVAQKSDSKMDAGERGRWRERENLERTAVAARLRELSGASGIIPASAGRREPLG